MATVRNIWRNEDHKNYCSALVALHKTAESLETFTENGLQIIHKKILQKLGNMPACAHLCSDKERNNFKRWCQTCLQWKAELERWLPPGIAVGIKWSRLHSWTWMNNARAIAEVFILPGWDTSNINLKDLSTILTIWQRCTQFPRQLVKLSDKLRQDRNNLAHTTMILDAQKKTEIFQDIRNVVNHQDVQPSIPNLPHVLQVLQELEQGDLFHYENDLDNALQGIRNALQDISERQKCKMERILIISLVVAFLSLLLYIPAIIFQLPNCLLINSDQENKFLRLSSKEGCLSDTTDTVQLGSVSLFEYLPYHNRFIGREWLFTALRQELFRNDSHGVLLEAGMGYGKSAIIAHIICADNISGAIEIRRKLVAFHVCRFDAIVSKRANVFIQRLVYMISKEFSEFNKSYNPCQSIFNEHSCEEDPYGCLDQCIIVPMKRIHFTTGTLVVIALDALDECFDAYRKENPILTLLKHRIHRFPKWVRFLITSRPSSDTKVLEKDLKFIRLNENDENNTKDISAYLKTVLENKSIVLSNNKNARSNNFLITTSVIENVEKIEIIPVSLDRYYEEQFIREFKIGNRIQFDDARYILEILCTIFIPPDESTFLNLVSNSSSMSQKTFTETLKGLQHFVRFTDGIYQLAHISIHDWLLNTTNEQFKISITNGHRLNANYLLNRIVNGTCDVNIVDLVIHVGFALDKDLKERFLSISDVCLNILKQKLDEYPIIALSKRVDSFEIMKLLATLYPDVNYRDEKGISPLFTAASFGHLETFKALIDLKADVTVRTDTFKDIINIDRAVEVSLEYQFWGYGVLDIAAQNGHFNIVEFIIKMNGSDYPLSKLNSIMLLPIHLACKRGHLNIVRQLFQTHPWMLYWQCLYYASEIGHYDLVNFIIEAGIKDKCRPCKLYLHWLPRDAIRVQGRIVSSENNSNYVLFDDWMNVTCETALHVAVRMNRFEIVKLFVQQRTALRCFDRGGRTPVIAAIQYGHGSIVDLFAENGIITGKEKCGKEKAINETFKLHENELEKLKENTCMKDLPMVHVAAQYDRAWFFKNVTRYNFSINMNQRDPNGCHMIHRAACYSSMDTMSVFEKLNFFENRLESYYKCRNGLTPLQSAIKCRSVASTEFLLNYSNFENQPDNIKFELIILAVEQDLERMGDLEGQETNIILILRMLIKQDSVLKLQDKNNRNIFHYAITKGHFGVISFLFSDYFLVSRILITAKDLNQMDPLHYAVDMILPSQEFQLKYSFFQDLKNESVLQQINVPISPEEHSIILTFNFMENIKAVNSNVDRMLFNKLVEKQCLHVIAYILVKSPTVIFESSTLSSIIQYDKHGLVLLTYYVIFAKRHDDIYQSGTKEEMLKISYVCKTCDEILDKCHLHGVARTYNKVSEIISLLQLDVLHVNILEKLFSHVDTNALSTCYDKDGFNILERAIQSGSPNLVQYLLQLQVTSSLEKTKLVFMALDPLKYIKDVDEIVFASILDEVYIHISFKNHTAFLAEMISSSDYTTRADTFIHIFDKNLMSTLHKRNSSDLLICQLLNAYQAYIPRTSICAEPAVRHFSLIHRLAIEGCTNSLKIIEKLWGGDLLKCQNLDGFTPMFLARILHFDDTIEYMKGIGITEMVPKQQAEFYLYSNILNRFFFYHKELKCILKLRRVTPHNIYGQIKLYKCMRHVCKSFIQCRIDLFKEFKGLKKIMTLNALSSLWRHTVDHILYKFKQDAKSWQKTIQGSPKNFKYDFYPLIKDQIKKETSSKNVKLLLDLETKTCKNLLKLRAELYTTGCNCFCNYLLKQTYLDRDLCRLFSLKKILDVIEVLVENIEPLGKFCSNICRDFILWRFNARDLKTISQNFNLLLIKKAATDDRQSPCQYFYCSRTYVSNTWLRLYYRYDYMKVLYYSRSYRKSYDYISDHLLGYRKYSVFSDILQYAFWRENAVKHVKKLSRK